MAWSIVTRTGVVANKTSLITFTSDDATVPLYEADIKVEGGKLVFRNPFELMNGTKEVNAYFIPDKGATSMAISLTGLAAMGSTNPVLMSPIITPDITKPTMQISVSDANLSVGEKAVVTFKTSEAVKDFTMADVRVVNGKLSDFKQVDDTTFTASFSATKGGNASIDVAANKFTDLVGNKNVLTNKVMLNSDITLPKMTITVSDKSLTAGEEAVVTFKASEAIQGFDLNDVTVSGGKLGSLKASSDNKTFTATFTPNEEVIETASISVSSNGFSDMTGNMNTAVASAKMSVNTATPTISVDQAGPIQTGSEIHFFGSTKLVDFTLSDIHTHGITLTDFKKVDTLGTHYSARVAFVENLNYYDMPTLDINAGSFKNSAGNVSKQGVYLFLDTPHVVEPSLPIPENPGADLLATPPSLIVDPWSLPMPPMPPSLGSMYVLPGHEGEFKYEPVPGVMY